MIPYNDINKLIETTLVELYNRAVTDNQGIYGFYAQDIFVGAESPAINEQKRYQVLYNIQDFRQEVTHRNTSINFLVVVQILDFVPQNDQTDHTYLLYEVLEGILEPSMNYLNEVAKNLKESGEVPYYYQVTKNIEKYRMRHFKDPNGVWNINQVYGITITTSSTI